MSKPKKARRHIPPVLRRSLQLMVFYLVVHYALVPQIAGLHKSASVIAHLNPWLMAAGVGTEAASLVAYAQLTRTLLPGNDRPGLLAVLRAQLATLGMSHILPGGGVAATPLGFRLLRRIGVSSADASFVLSTQAVGSALVLNVIFWVALVISIPIRGFNDANLGLAFGGSAAVVGFATLVFGIAHGSKRADRFVTWVTDKVPFLSAEAASKFLHDIVSRFQTLASDRGLMARAATWAALQWLLDASSLWIFLSALGIGTSPDGLLIAFGLANLSAAIPLTPGGVGVYEAILVSSLVGFGVPRAQAIIGVLAYRFFEFWLPIPIGVAAYLSAEASSPIEGDAAEESLTASEPH